MWRKGDRIRKSLQMAPVPVTTPTNGENDQVQAFEKIPTPVSEEALPVDSSPENAPLKGAPLEDAPREDSFSENVPTEDA